MKTEILNVITVSFCITLAVGTANAATFESSPSAEIAQRMQEAPKPEFVPGISADEQARAWVVANGLTEGWDYENKRFVAIGSGLFNSEDPTYDDSFIAKRSAQSMVASLTAKSDIIGYMRTTMDAMDRVVTPGDDLHAAFNEEKERLEGKLEGQVAVVAKALADLDAKEAAFLEGATLKDKMGAAMDAAIAKLDEEYSAEGIEEKKKEKYERAKKRYKEAKEEYETLEKEAEKLKGEVTEEASSVVKTVSKMPLFGAVTMAQFESWDEDEEMYNIAQVVMWSSKMEKIVRAMIKGEKMNIPPGKMSIGEWVNSQDWSTSTGSRRFRDNNGEVYFVGIAAAAFRPKSASSIKKAKLHSKKMAQKEAVMAVFADIDATQEAGTLMKELSGGAGADTSIAATTVSQNLIQKIEGREVQGNSPILQPKRYLHPISQKDIFVSIYAISSAAARAAMWAEKESYLTAMLDTKAQKASAGVKAGLDSSLKKEQADTKAYDEAKAKTEEEMEKKAKAATGAAKSTAGSGSVAGAGQDESEEECPEGQTGQKKKKAQSGSTAGAGQSDSSW